MLHEFSRKPTIFDKIYFCQRTGGPSVILSKINFTTHFSFFMNFFMNSQRQNVTNATVTYVTNFCEEGF